MNGQAAGGRRHDGNDAERVLVCNPASGSGDHAPAIRARALDRGFDVLETTGAGDARRFTHEAATEGASLVAVAGGDGTVNEVVRGLADADAFETTDVAVIPTGTANLFARNVGIDSVDRGFEVLDAGERRQIDVGFADGRPFVNTCLAGLTAEANTSTPGELKRRLGPLAYVLTTLWHLPEYDGVPLRVTIDPESRSDARSIEEWRGDALLVLVGNAFRLPDLGRNRSSVADGQLSVTILEERPPVESFEAESISGWLADASSPLTRVEASSLSIAALEDEPVAFSLDGELHFAAALDVTVRERCLSLFVDPSDQSVRR